jgi:hypothetical protein
MVVHITEYPCNYLTFGNLVERAGVRCTSQTSLTVLKKQEFLLISNNIPDNLTVRNNTTFILPAGFKVKRGFNVDSTDHVHEHDQYYYLVVSNDEGPIVSFISDLILPNDLLEE